MKLMVSITMERHYRVVVVHMGVAKLFLYFLHLFSNFIQLFYVLFTPVQLCTFLIFWENFYMSRFTPFFIVLTWTLNDLN